jgi:hypothetical protein
VSALPPLRVTLLELLDYRQLTNVMSYEMALSMTLGAGMKWISSARTPLTRSSSRVGPYSTAWGGLDWTRLDGRRSGCLARTGGTAIATTRGDYAHKRAAMGIG